MPSKRMFQTSRLPCLRSCSCLCPAFVSAAGPPSCAASRVRRWRNLITCACRSSHCPSQLPPVSGRRLLHVFHTSRLRHAAGPLVLTLQDSFSCPLIALHCCHEVGRAHRLWRRAEAAHSDRQRIRTRYYSPRLAPRFRFGQESALTGMEAADSGQQQLRSGRSGRGAP